MLGDGPQDRATRRVGTTVGHYRLERLLGVGGMGAVFAATSRSGRFAVKILHAELARDKNIAARFAREAYVGNRVGHRGVPRTFEHGYDAQNAPYLVMELLEGES